MMQPACPGPVTQLFHSSPNVQAAIVTTCSSAAAPPSPPPHTHTVIHVTFQIVDPSPFADVAHLECSPRVLFSAFMGLLLKSQRTSKRGGGVWGGVGVSYIPPAKVRCWGSCAQRARHMMHRARLPSQPCVIHLVAGPRGERDLL